LVVLAGTRDATAGILIMFGPSTSAIAAASTFSQSSSVVGRFSTPAAVMSVATASNSTSADGAMMPSMMSWMLLTML
jgi:hypothetical protein